MGLAHSGEARSWLGLYWTLPAHWSGTFGTHRACPYGARPLGEAYKVVVNRYFALGHRYQRLPALFGSSKRGRAN